MSYVAVVDDEEQVRKALTRLLLASGLDAESYACGKDFLGGIAKRAPDCVLLDLHMPGMTGLGQSCTSCGGRGARAGGW